MRKLLFLALLVPFAAHADPYQVVATCGSQSLITGDGVSGYIDATGHICTTTGSGGGGGATTISGPLGQTTKSASLPVTVASDQGSLAVTDSTPVAQGSTTAGQLGPLAQAAVTTGTPAYTTGQTAPLSMGTTGFLRTWSVPITPGGTQVYEGFSAAAGAVNAGFGASGVYLSTLPTLTNTQAIGLTLTPQAALRTSGGGQQSTLNITTATSVKATPGRVYRVVLNTAGSTATSIIDSASTTATAANTILTIPSTATAGTVFFIDWPCAAGIGVVPGTSAVISVSFE